MLNLLYKTCRLFVLIAVLLFCHFANSNELFKALDIHSLAIPGSETQAIELLYINRQITTSLDNDDLDRITLDLSSLDTISGAQRNMNYYWLLSNTQQIEIHTGKSAVNKILQNRVQYFWGGIKEDKFRFNTLVPDSNGNASFSPYTNYKFSVSDKDIEFALTYNF